MSKAKHPRLMPMARREMRDFIFRHLYLVPATEHDVLVLRYGLIGWHAELEWREIGKLAGVRYPEAIHDKAVKRIVRFSPDKKLPLALLRPYEDIEAIKLRARVAVKSAIKCGKLSRQPCERCGASKTQAHHPNYQHPLEVLWLCKKCHAQEHTKREMAARAEGRTWKAA